MSKSGVVRSAAVPDGDLGPPVAPPASGLTGNGLTRMTVNLNRQAVQALDQVSAATGYSKTDSVNRAIQIYAIVNAIMERNDGVLRVAHVDGEVERIYLV